MPHPLTQELEQHGIAVVPGLVSPEQLANMQRAFAGRLTRPRWNDVDGYEQTEPQRHMVQDVLTLDQGFVDFALHPTVKQVLREYVGERAALVEAKGWKSLPTTRDFHGWHGDAWYDQSKVDFIPREVKLALYLTDVKSGAFTYLRGSHGKQVPRPVRRDEAQQFPTEKILEANGPAGTAILFDTSGIHRQAVPILEERQAIFLNYHDPAIPLQAEDVAYYRYHPLLLNAAFLGNLSVEDQRLLGFGDKTNYLPGYERSNPHTWFQAIVGGTFRSKLRLREFRKRVTAKLKRLVGLA